MSAFSNTLNKLPKWTIILSIMIVTNFLTFSLQNDIVEIHESQISQLTQQVREHKVAFEAQQLESLSLRNQLSESYEEITKPDGTKIKRHIKDVLNERHELKEQKLRLEYEYKIKDLQRQLKIARSYKEVTTKGLGVGYGFTTKLRQVITGQYDAWGNIGFIGTFSPTDGEVGLGIGVRF